MIGSRNEANVLGNLAAVNTYGNDNRNNLRPAALKPGDSLFTPTLSENTVFGNGNKVDSEGNGNFDGRHRQRQPVEHQGQQQRDERVRQRQQGGAEALLVGQAGVQGNGNTTTIVGNDSRASAKGNFNLTSVFGNRSTARSYGDNNVSTAAGDDKKTISTDVS